MILKSSDHFSLMEFIDYQCSSNLYFRQVKTRRAHDCIKNVWLQFDQMAGVKRPTPPNGVRGLAHLVRSTVKGVTHAGCKAKSQTKNLFIKEHFM